MKKLVVFSFTLLAMLFASCSEKQEKVLLSEMGYVEDRAVLESNPVQDVVFCEGSDIYMVPRKDPYTLSNFKEALARIVNGDSQIAFPENLTKSSFDDLELSPTHYALKIYPRNEKEQWAVELLEDVKVAYIPFDYVQVSEEDSLALKQAIQVGVPDFQEISPYVEVYEEVYTNDGPAIPESFRMPILYAVWPCEKPLPDTLDYVLDYEVFIPDYSGSTKSISDVDEDLMRVLETEAISLALGTTVSTTKSSTSSIRTITGTLMSRDWLLNEWLPLRNLKVRFQLGSKICDTYVREDGSFSITNEISLDGSMSYVFQHPRWKLTSMSSTTPIMVTYDDLGSVVDENNYHANYMSHNYPLFEVHHAVDYFYNNSHQIPKWYYESGIRIRVSESSHSEWDGLFSCSNYESAYITIYNNYDYKQMYKDVSVLMHELGHFVHYGERDNFEDYVQVHDLIQESFASYVGWLLGNKFYTDKGYTGNLGEIGNQSRQSWRKTHDVDEDNGLYSPLFVDLVDDYNQGATNSALPTDRIKNFPNSIIMTIVEEDYNWSKVKSRLNSYVGTYYTAEDLNAYLSNYDYWFSNN